jgi:hypothetical protein
MDTSKEHLSAVASDEPCMVADTAKLAHSSLSGTTIARLVVPVALLIESTDSSGVHELIDTAWMSQKLFSSPDTSLKRSARVPPQGLATTSDTIFIESSWPSTIVRSCVHVRPPSTEASKEHQSLASSKEAWNVAETVKCDHAAVSGTTILSVDVPPVSPPRKRTEANGW